MACEIARGHNPGSPVVTAPGVVTSRPAFSSIFGRTHLAIGASRAKKCEDSVREVRFRVAPRIFANIFKKLPKFRENFRDRRHREVSTARRV